MKKPDKESGTRLNRRNFTGGAIGAAIGGAAVAPWIMSARAQNIRDIEQGRRQPNILMIVMDQERAWHDLPFGLQLPIRNGFANEGICFSQYHVNTTPCAPSRAVIWSGQHAQKTGVISNPGQAGSLELENDRTPTMPAMLRDKGYYTALKGKWHLTDLRNFRGDDLNTALQQVGFDEWQRSPDTFGKVNEAAQRDSMIARDAVEFLYNRPSQINGKPWYLAVNFIHPHDVMWFDATGMQQQKRINPNFVSMMDGAMDRWPFNEDLGFELPASYFANPSNWPYAQTAYRQINDVFYGELPDDPEAYRRLQNFYFNCLRDSEANLKTVLDALAATQQDQETIVILTSDHGEMAGAHRQRNKGPFMFKENLRVPLAIRNPISGAIGSPKIPVSSMDLTPTALGFSGVNDDEMSERYAFLKGMDLGSVIANPKSNDRQERDILIQFNSLSQTNPEIFTERVIDDLTAKQNNSPPRVREWPLEDVQFEKRGFGRGIFDGRYKFARWFSPGDHHKPNDWTDLLARNDIELIDTQEDPDEVINLANDLNDHRELIMTMNKKLNAIIELEIGIDDGSYLPGDPNFWRG